MVETELSLWRKFEVAILRPKLRNFNLQLLEAG